MANMPLYHLQCKYKQTTNLFSGREFGQGPTSTPFCGDTDELSLEDIPNSSLLTSKPSSVAWLWRFVGGDSGNVSIAFSKSSYGG